MSRPSPAESVYRTSKKRGAARSTILCGDERAAPEWGMVRGPGILTRGDVSCAERWPVASANSAPGTGFRVVAGLLVAGFNDGKFWMIRPASTIDSIPSSSLRHGSREQN